MKRGQWLQVDPLRDKYAGWSEYNYVEGNPHFRARINDPFLGIFYAGDPAGFDNLNFLEEAKFIISSEI